MTSQLTLTMAQARIDDLRGAADARRVEHGRPRSPRSGPNERSVTLRFGSAGDQRALARLAELDSAKPPAQPVLLAEVDKRLLAALSLADGTAITDPFHPTVELLDLLRARAQQLQSNGRTGRCGRLRSWARLCRPAAGEAINATPLRG